MELRWPHRRCILCRREHDPDAVPFSRAHLFPDSIGGFAWAWTKCKECNEEVGSSIESAVVNDDSIRLSIRALRDQLPELANKFDERTTWIARPDEGPAIEARLRDGAFQILTTKDKDGGLRQSTENARRGLEKRLQRENRSAEEIDEALGTFDSTPSMSPSRSVGEPSSTARRRTPSATRSTGSPSPTPSRP